MTPSPTNQKFQAILVLIKNGSLKISDHGYDELIADGLFVRQILAGTLNAIVIEDDSTYPKGPCVLVLQVDEDGEPIHVLWGIPKGHTAPAVLITAYRPDPAQWDSTFTRRKK